MSARLLLPRGRRQMALLVLLNVSLSAELAHAAPRRMFISCLGNELEAADLLELHLT